MSLTPFFHGSYPMPKAKKEADKATGNDDKKYLGFERHRLAPERSIMQEQAGLSCGKRTSRSRWEL